MPIPPRPFTLICSQCTWQKTIAPKSDVLLPGRDWFSTCPQCTHPELERRNASQQDLLRLRLAQFLGRDRR